MLCLLINVLFMAAPVPGQALRGSAAPAPSSALLGDAAGALPIKMCPKGQSQAWPEPGTAHTQPWGLALAAQDTESSQILPKLPAEHSNISFSPQPGNRAQLCPAPGQPRVAQQSKQRISANLSPQLLQASFYCREMTREHIQ